MKKIITKEFNFCYAHRLENSASNYDENIEIFGKCFIDIHGHNAKMFVSVSGKEVNGMIINFTELKKIVNENIVDVLDHRNLNELEMFKNQITTCENVIEWIWGKLEIVLGEKNIILEKIKLYETDTSFCELEKENGSNN